MFATEKPQILLLLRRFPPFLFLRALSSPPAMPLFISDEELQRHANNAALIAEKADSYIRDLQKQLETYKAQADAAAITAEQSCAIVEQKYIYLSTEFAKLENQNAQLTASLDQRLAELAEVQAEKHQLHLKAINKDGEVERLSIESGEIQKSKRQLLELLEQRDLEIKEKNGTIKSYLDKIVNLTDDANLKEARLHDSEAQLARTLAASARLSQEKELVEKHNVWLNEELTAKVNNFLELRRTHSELEAEMSAKLAEVEKQLNECSGSLKWTSERVKELEVKLTSAQEELCSAKNTAATNEEHFSAELSTASKLVELYKESTEEWSRKAGELEGVIKALETHLSQVEDDYKDKLEKETSVRKALETEVADLKEKFEKCENEMENARKTNEFSLLQLVSLQSYSNTEDIMIGGREADEGNDFDKMLVPRIPVGVSGTALAASLLRDGWSLAKMYAKYQETVDALRHEQIGRKQSQAILERVLYEIQEKAEVILDERSEHERMVEAYTMMNQKLQQSRAEQSNYETTLVELKADLKRHERDYEIAQKEIRDLEKQVTVLLKECRDIQLRCGAGNQGSLDDRSSFPDAGMDNESEADKIISERLLTFRDINGLVEQNVQLRSLVRNLVSEIEQKEVEIKERFEMKLRKQNDETAAKVEAVLKRSEEQGLMIESLHNSVGMYKRLYEEELKSNAALPHSIEALPDGKKDFMRPFEDQEASKKALERVSDRAKKLEDDMAKARNEVISLRLERDKLALEANFAQDRLESLIKESEHQRDETNGIRARNVEFSQLIVDYQRRIRESSHSVQVAEELSRKLSMEVSILKHERDILLNSEKRASEEVHRLYEEKHRLQASLNTIHSAEEIREESRAMERRKLEESLNRVEREWAEAKQELQDVRDHVRTLTVEREEILKNSMRQVEEMRKELTNALGAVAAAEAKAAVSEARCSEMEAKLKGSETKVGEKGPGFNQLPICSIEEVTTDQQKEKEEFESLKQELQAYKDHMLQFKEIAQVNESALKQIESAHEKFKSEAEKMKKSLETEIHSLRGRISELEGDVLAKSLEASSALAEKENALSSALAEIALLRDESSVKGSQVEEMDARISSLKEDLEKEHLRWRTAQDNYERQVLLQSDTIQELKRTSQALAVLQDESLELHKSVDTLKSKNDLLKATWESEKSVLEELKNKAEQKYNEVNEQNNILLNRLEALHIKLAERERSIPGISSVSPSQNPQGESDLENVIKYLRRSKTIAETEVSLLKQEQLRLQSNLESALRASEAAQASLQAEHASSRAMLFTEEEFKSLQLQVREMNLLRESNMQLREENKHNFEDSQKFREFTQKAKVEIEHLGSLLKEKDIELEASRKEVEMLKLEIKQWENRISKLLERNESIDVEDYDRMKGEFLQIQEKLAEMEAEVEDSRILVSEKEKKISDMEQDLAKKELELTELEKRIQDTAQVEKGLQSEVEKLKKIAANWKRRYEISSKEVEELKKEKQTLSKQIEDSRSSKRSMGEATKQHEATLRQELIAQHEKALKEKEKEKDTRIQILEKTLEREREEKTKLRLRQQKDRKAISDLVEKIQQEKKKLDEELDRHKHARDNLFEVSGSSPAQLPPEADLEEKRDAYILAVEQLEEAANSTFSDGPVTRLVSADASHVDTSSAMNDGKSGHQVHAQSLTTHQPIVATLPALQVKPVEEKEQKFNVSKPNTEARKMGRKLIRPRLEPSQEPSGDVDMSEMEGDSILEEGVKFGGPPQDLETQVHRASLQLPNTSTRKRLATSSATELREESLNLPEMRSDVAPPLPKKSKGLDCSQESVEEPSKDLSSESLKKLLSVEDLGEAAEDSIQAFNKQEEPSVDDLGDIAEDSINALNKQEVVNAAKGEETDASAKLLEDPHASAKELEETKQSFDFMTEVESQNASDAIMEEMLDNPTRVTEEPSDWGANVGDGLEAKHSPLLEGEDGREEGELVSDFGEMHEGVDMIVMTPEDGEAQSESFPGRGGADMEDGGGVDASDGIEIISPEVLPEEKNEDGTGAVDEIAEGSDKSNNNDGATEVEQSSHAPYSATSNETLQDVITESVESKQESPLVSETVENEQQSARRGTTISLTERARERALLRQAGVVSPPLTRGRGRTRDVGRGGRGGRGTRRQLGNDKSEG